ncbi:MAG: hypothetical protein ACWIPJ_04145, partial [Polaribacter sp.]
TPIKKLKNKKGFFFSFKGYKKTKLIYKYGFINPRKEMLFNTKTCKKTKNSNKKPKYNALFIF